MRIRHRILSAAGIGLVTASAAAQQLESPGQDRDDEHQIEEIIVQAMPLGRAIEQLAQPTSVVDAITLVRRETASLGETLADELGVNSTYFGPVAARPVIRGQYGERIRILQNGLDVLDASALSEDHAVSLDSILADRVEIVKGPATLLYGSGAAGGIVNVVDSRIHETAPDTRFFGAASVGGDSATDRRSAALKLDASNGTITGHFDYFRRDTDNIEIPGFAESEILRSLEEEEPGAEEEEEAFGVVENTDSEVQGGAAALSFTDDRGFIGLSVSRYESEYGVPGAHEHEHGEEEEEEEEIIRIDLEQTRYDLRSGLNLSGPFESLTFDLTVNDYTHVELEGAEVGTLYDTQGTDVRLQLQHAPWGLFEGAFGLQYKSIDFEAVGDEAFVPESDTQQLAVFLFEEVELSEQWTLQGSARIENQSIDTPALPDYDETAAGASIGAIWSFADGISLSGNLSLTERHPNSTELYANGPHLAVQRFECGSYFLLDAEGSCENGDFNPSGELSKELSTNVDLTLRGATGRLEWSITGFVNDVRDYIVLLPTGGEGDGLPAFAFAQVDAELYGFEGEVLIDLFVDGGRNVHARLFSDYVYGEEKDSGRYLPRLPPLRYGAALHYVNGTIDAGIELMHNAEQSRTADDELPTDSFTMVNAQLSYMFPDPAIMVFVRGTNLGDEDARRHSSPLKDFVPLPGRSVMAGLRWDF